MGRGWGVVWDVGSVVWGGWHVAVIVVGSGCRVVWGARTVVMWL